MSATEIPRVYYLLTLGYTLIDRPGTADDVNYLQVIGAYDEFDNAKKAIDAHAHLIMDNDTQYLNLYKVDLEQCKMYSFYRKDLKGPIEKALAKQKMQDAKAREKTRLELEKEKTDKSVGGKPWVFHLPLKAHDTASNEPN